MSSQIRWSSTSTWEEQLLFVRDLTVHYGGYLALSEVSLEVGQREIVCVMGANGSGKSTLLNAVSGLVESSGEIVFEGRSLQGVPTHERLALGLAHVLERRRLFPFMTVSENLLLGAYLPSLRSARAQSLERVESLFPILRERRRQLGAQPVRWRAAAGSDRTCADGQPALPDAGRTVPRPLAEDGDGNFAGDPSHSTRTVSRYCSTSKACSIRSASPTAATYSRVGEWPFRAPAPNCSPIRGCTTFTWVSPQRDWDARYLPRWGDRALGADCATPPEAPGWRHEADVPSGFMNACFPVEERNGAGEAD